MKNVKNISRAVEVLKEGGVVIFPTDTVWGVGAIVSSKKGVEKLYEIKKRESHKPTVILVSNIDMANKYGVISEDARRLAEKYWPGALTIIMKARENKVPALVRGGRKTVGLRVGDSVVVQELIEGVGEGIVAGSANFAGKRAPERKGELDERLVNQVNLVVEGKTGRQAASTVVDTTVRPWQVLRQGPVKLEVRGD